MNIKKILLSLSLIFCIPSILLAAAEFRFVTEEGDRSVEYLHDRVDETYYLEDQAVLTMDDMQAAESIFTESGMPGISIDFSESGQQRFAAITAQGANKTLAFLIDDRVVTQAIIRNEINASSVKFPIQASSREVAGYVAAINSELTQREQQKEAQELAAKRNVISQRMNQQSANNNKPTVNIANKAEDFAKGFIGKKLFDFLLNNIIFVLIGLFVFLPLLKKVITAIFSALIGMLAIDKSGAAQNLTKGLPLIISKNRSDESARDKGQRLLGDGRFVEAMRYLRPYCLQHPKDEQAKALLMNATAWSGINDASTKKSRRDDAHDARRRMESDRLRAGSSAIDNAKQSISSFKLDKTQALQMARSILEKSK